MGDMLRNLLLVKNIFFACYLHLYVYLSESLTQGTGCQASTFVLNMFHCDLILNLCKGQSVREYFIQNQEAGSFVV